MLTVAAPSTSRREANRLSRREAIIDVAARSFLDKGYAGTSMSAIAANLGGSKGTLWSYFPGKAELFAAVLDRAMDGFQRELLSILDPAGPVESVLTRFCRHFLAKICSPEAVALHRAVAGEAGRFPEMGRIFYERGPGRTRESLAVYLEACMARGQLLCNDAMAAAIHLTGMCLSGCHMQLLVGVIDNATPAMRDADVDSALSLFLRAYKP